MVNINSSRWPGRQGDVTAIAVAPDRSWVLSGGDRDGALAAWTPDGSRRTLLPGHSWRAWSVTFAPDGSWFASGAHDQKVMVWHGPSRQRLFTLTGPTQEHVVFWAVAAAPDGTWLAGADSGGTVWIWETQRWTLRATLTGHYAAITPLVIAPDSTWLAVGDHLGRVCVYDVAQWRIRAVIPAHPQYCWALAVAPDGRWLVTGSGRDHLVRTWDTAPFATPGAPTAPEPPPTGGLRRLWRGGRPTPPWLPAPLELTPLATMTGHTDGVSVVTVAPHGRLIASGGHDSTVYLWDTATARPLARHVLPGKVYALTWWPDGTALLAGTAVGLYRLDLA